MNAPKQEKSKQTSPSDEIERESRAADELESEMEDRDDARMESELDEQTDLNQGMDTGTHDSTRLGVDWPASYKVPMRPAKSEQPSETPKKDPNSKG
jgi:hypothetical protein